MFVGVARIVLQIPGARSLKDRRRVVKSFKDRLRARGAVSVAELGDVESYQLARLGVAVVSGDRRRCQDELDAVIGLAHHLGDAILADSAREVIPFGQHGASVGGGIESALGDSPRDPEPASEGPVTVRDDDLPWGSR